MIKKVQKYKKLLKHKDSELNSVYRQGVSGSVVNDIYHTINFTEASHKKHSGRKYTTPGGVNRYLQKSATTQPNFKGLEKQSLRDIPKPHIYEEIK